MTIRSIITQEEYLKLDSTYYKKERIKRVHNYLKLPPKNVNYSAILHTDIPIQVFDIMTWEDIYALNLGLTKTNCVYNKSTEYTQYLVYLELRKIMTFDPQFEYLLDLIETNIGAAWFSSNQIILVRYMIIEEK